jgi:hypothetical protein
VGSGSGGVDWVGIALLGASYALLFVFLGANIRMAGVPLITAGIALNALVIGVNGGMPVSDAALRSASGEVGRYEATRAELEEQGAPKHHLAGADDVLRPLTDVVGLGPPISQVYSAGDFLAMAGIVWLFAAATRGPPGRHAPGRHAPGRNAAARRKRPARPSDPS